MWLLVIILPIGQHGSQLRVKGRTQGTAVRFTRRCKTHLPTYIIENPPTVSAQAMFSVSILRLCFWLSICNEDSSKKDKETKIKTFYHPHYLSFSQLYQKCGPHLFFSVSSIKLKIPYLCTGFLFYYVFSVNQHKERPYIFTQFHKMLDLFWIDVHPQFWIFLFLWSLVISVMRNAHKLMTNEPHVIQRFFSSQKKKYLWFNFSFLFWLNVICDI